MAGTAKAKPQPTGWGDVKQQNGGAAEAESGSTDRLARLEKLVAHLYKLQGLDPDDERIGG